jgi:predicted small secreted protein
MKRTTKLAFLGVIAIAALASCNTTIGLGRDMRVLGITESWKVKNQVRRRSLTCGALPRLRLRLPRGQRRREGVLCVRVRACVRACVCVCV